MLNIGFIGAGNMGAAIIKGAFSLRNIRIFAYDTDESKLGRLKDYGVTPCLSEKELAERCTYIILAVKPNHLDEVLGNIKEHIGENTVLISICAGITDEYIKTRTNPTAKIILSMPNTPLLLGEGATALAKTEYVTEEEFGNVCGIFSSCGKIAVIDKSKMKEIIAVNGSSPAFIYLFSKVFIDYAESAGIESETAKELFAQALTGSAKMILESGYSIDDLITMVASKGGTTEAGLSKLRENNFESAVTAACKACTARAYELNH